MPQDKLNTQWSDDWSREASTYTQDQGQQNASQARPHSQRGRQHVDNADQSQPEPYKAYVKPRQPDCDGMQFARNPYDADNYLNVRVDAFDNEIPQDRTMHTPMPAGDMGSFGGNQYAEFQKNANDGYGVEIPHGQSAAFNTASITWIDNSVAGRGPDWVESTDDSGQTGPSRPSSDSNNVARGSVPPIMRNRGR